MPATLRRACCIQTGGELERESAFRDKLFVALACTLYTKKHRQKSYAQRKRKRNGVVQSPLLARSEFPSSKRKTQPPEWQNKHTVFPGASLRRVEPHENNTRRARAPRTKSFTLRAYSSVFTRECSAQTHVGYSVLYSTVHITGEVKCTPFGEQVNCEVRDE